MTRSRKKTPCCHCAGHDGSWKAIYNRRLRRIPNIDFENGVSAIPDGMAYRKLNCPWNISDLKVTNLTYAGWLGDGEDAAEDRNWYERYYIRK
jgi:hypothetical protein